MTKLPEVEEPCRSLAKDCRKLVRLLDPLLLPPKALTRLLKLVCRLLSAVLTLLLVVLLSVELDEPDRV